MKQFLFVLAVAGILALSARCQMPGFQMISLPAETNANAATASLIGSGQVPIVLGPFNSETRLGFAVGCVIASTNAGGAAPSAGNFFLKLSQSLDGTTNTLESTPSLSLTCAANSSGSLVFTNSWTNGTTVWLIATIASNSVPATNLMSVTPRCYVLLKPQIGY